MINLKGQLLTLKNGKQYLAIDNKKVNDINLCVTVDFDCPIEIKILDVRIGDEGQIESRSYNGEDAQAIIQEYKPKIMDYLQDIKKMVTRGS